MDGFDRLSWFASIGIWLVVVVRSGIFSADVPAAMFWINFLIFLAAGLGALATRHFIASALPNLLGLLALTSRDFKEAWAFVSLYIIAATVIGLCAFIAALVGRSPRRDSNREST